MTVGLEFGIDQFVVHTDFELASVRRDQGQVFDIVLEVLKQVVRQAHGPVGVVSYSAIDDFDVQHWVMLSKDHVTERSDWKERSRSADFARPRPSTTLLLFEYDVAPLVIPLTCACATGAGRYGNLLENYNMCAQEACNMEDVGL